jgi:hypothetical protein
MVPILSLVVPILVAAVVVFLTSALMHMVLKYHNSDYGKLGNEEAVGNALRGASLGHFVIPHSGGGQAFKDPAFIERMKRGPVAFITVLPSAAPNMGKSLGQWFAFTLAVGVVAAYVAGRALGPGAEYLQVFRFVGTTAFLAYAVGSMQESIWFGRKWSVTGKHMLDGLVYALLTAGVFGWLWPN